MSSGRSPLLLLLRNALRMDFRVRGAERGRRWRAAQPLAATLFFYGLIGLAIGASLSSSGLSLHARATLVFALAGILVMLNLMVEYHDILIAPVDTDVLGWRPITSRTLYLARVLHILVYVGLLMATFLAGPALFLGFFGPHGGLLVGLGFFAAGFANALFTTAILLLLQGVLLHRLSAERFQDLLAHVQLAVMLGMVLGYQVLTPAILGVALGEQSRWSRWLPAWPPAWFAALPALLAGFRDRQLVIGLGAAVVGLVGFGAIALRRLGPGYQMRIEAVRAAGGKPPARPTRMPAWQGWLGSWLGRQPLRRCGFDFFLAQLRGDHRLRVALLPLLAFPIGLLIAALILGGGADPYSDHTRVAAWVRSMNPEAAQATRMRGQLALFTAVYLVPSMMLTLGRSLARSNDWRAAWVFHAAPLGRYDHFYAGILWGVFAALLVPCIVVVSAVLLAVWRQPWHVAAHLSLPIGFALLALPLAQLVGFTPPFTGEPIRHTRSREMVYSLVVTMPLVALAAFHWAVRQRPGLLVACGLGLASACVLLGGLLVQRVRNVFLHRTFDA